MSLKEGIEEKLRIPTRIRMGAPGALDVYVDGRKIFSKGQSGRMPTVDEIVGMIRNG